MKIKSKIVLHIGKRLIYMYDVSTYYYKSRESLLYLMLGNDKRSFVLMYYNIRYLHTTII